jgi:hypothetical protein
VAIFVHAQIAEPDGSRFEDAIAKLRECPERELRTHPARYFMKMQTFARGAMTKTEQSAEPDREVVECAIAEVLRIAQRQGITPDDFVRMLDSGMQISDFLTAMEPRTNTRPINFS